MRAGDERERQNKNDEKRNTRWKIGSLLGLGAGRGELDFEYSVSHLFKPSGFNTSSSCALIAY